MTMHSRYKYLIKKLLKKNFRMRCFFIIVKITEVKNSGKNGVGVENGLKYDPMGS